ncbi:hypothetical protein LTLLF_157525 [Microtus ochrogaster]|uniref:Domain of unknown function with conserved HDNR motif domain-containing protein n=1 Tax=Microtus ochrogaster TaxID=79684 RepID=A0A8J6GES2_MICOH|nr:hypothetical protein LTLLF_157525 [Microtus ochrogaster]
MRPKDFNGFNGFNNPNSFTVSHDPAPVTSGNEAPSATANSWTPGPAQHNSGFYGHYRGQVKSESAGEYRRAAKPPPPAVFLQRCEEPARQHFFSKHDNRTSFDKGIGRRKDLERLWKRHTFLRWAPCELELSQQPPLESSYQIDFPSGTGLARLPQRLVHFVQVQPPYANTTYQHNFCRSSRGGPCGSAKTKAPPTPVPKAVTQLPSPVPPSSYRAMGSSLSAEKEPNLLLY